MDTVTKSLIWSAVIIVFALAAVSGLFESETTQTMMVILPVLAWATIGRRACAPCRTPFSGDKP